MNKTRRRLHESLKFKSYCMEIYILTLFEVEIFNTNCIPLMKP